MKGKDTNGMLGVGREEELLIWDTGKPILLFGHIICKFCALGVYPHSWKSIANAKANGTRANLDAPAVSEALTSGPVVASELDAPNKVKTSNPPVLTVEEDILQAIDLAQEIQKEFIKTEQSIG